MVDAFFADCLGPEGMSSRVADHSVDVILTDLPYGLSECRWDTPLDLDALWREYDRALKPFGTVVLFAQQPFTSRLVSSNYDMFKYSLVWQKSRPGAFAQAPYRFLCAHEDILVFSRAGTAKNARHRMTYNPQGTVACHRIEAGKKGRTSHREGRATQADYVQTRTNYPRSVLAFANEARVAHPTQKPLALLEYLVSTFSNEGDLIMDSCMGSGTTGVAAKRLGRRFIGFENDAAIFALAQSRLAQNERVE